MENNNGQKQDYGTKGLSLAIVVGVAIGTLLGRLMNNMNTGLMIGLVIGVCGWVLITRMKAAKKQDAAGEENGDQK